MSSGNRLAPAALPAGASLARQCPFCGKPVSRQLRNCPHCREAVPEITKQQPAPVAKRGRIREGLLYMLLAVVIHFFAGGYSAMHLPYLIDPVVTVYLSPLLFLSGLGLTVYGLYLRSKG